LRRISARDAEAMKRARNDMKFRRHAGTDQPSGVLQAFFEEQIERADRDESPRQPAQVGGPRRHGLDGYVRSAGFHAQQRAPAEAVVLRRPYELTAIRMRIGNAAGAIVEHG